MHSPAQVPTGTPARDLLKSCAVRLVDGGSGESVASFTLDVDGSGGTPSAKPDGFNVVGVGLVRIHREYFTGIGKTCNTSRIYN